MNQKIWRLAKQRKSLEALLRSTERGILKLKYNCHLKPKKRFKKTKH